MITGAAFLLFAMLLQLAVGAALWPNPRLRWLAALLHLNAAVALFSAIETNVPAAEFQVSDTLDAATSAILLGHVAAWRGASRKVLGGIVAMGAIQVLGVALVPTLRAGSGAIVWTSIPLYLSYAVVSIDALRAGGSGWVLAAFAPRAAYFATLLLSVDLRGGIPPGLAGLNHIASWIGGLAALAAATVWPWLRREVRWLPLAGFAAGALVGVPESFAIFGDPAVAATLNFLTLGAMRPFLLLFGFARPHAARVLAHVAAAAATTLIVLLGGVLFLALGVSIAGGIAAGFGIVVLAALVSAGNGMRRGDKDEPAWQSILLSLRGSSSGDPVPSWTQTHLAHRTGLGARRVSEFPEALNATAATKLDQYIPSWRTTTPPNGPPALVVKHRGIVRGVRGPRTYYRLTPWGERLAQAVASKRQLDGPTPDIHAESAPS